MMRLLTIGIILIISIAGCKPDDAPDILLPYNLVYAIDVSNTEEGLVSVTATAESANYYGFEFFEEDGSTLVENKEGEAEHQFSKTGTYAIAIRAHATFEHYIEIIDSVSIIITEDTNGIPTTGYTTPLSYAGYNLVWHDEFQGNSLSSDWTHDIGIGNNGWGNNELQYYRPENTEVRDGYLFITAKEEVFGGRNYTSSRIITMGKQSFKYGRIDIRAALPYGQGLWPALWMLGNSFPTSGWPSCGEIDIMEMTGGTGDNRIFGTAHWDNGGLHAESGNTNTLSSGIYADEFHVFSIIWDNSSIKWYRDDIKYHELNITPAGLSEFHQNFFLLINLAVGGTLPGNPDPSTEFPQRLIVDYVRVFQK